MARTASKADLGQPANDQAPVPPAIDPDSGQPCARSRLLLDKTTRRRRGPKAPGSVKGIAFSISELLLVQAWAEANDVAMRICLDHGSRLEEYEEAISIESEGGPVGRALIWRNEAAVYVQPLPGRRRRYAAISAALESLAPEEQVSVTDIVAKSWPKA